MRSLLYLNNDDAVRVRADAGLHHCPVRLLRAGAAGRAAHLAVAPEAHRAEHQLRSEDGGAELKIRLAVQSAESVAERGNTPGSEAAVQFGAWAQAGGDGRGRDARDRCR